MTTKFDAASLIADALAHRDTTRSFGADDPELELELELELTPDTDATHILVELERIMRRVKRRRDSRAALLNVWTAALDEARMMVQLLADAAKPSDSETLWMETLAREARRITNTKTFELPSGTVKTTGRDAGVDLEITDKDAFVAWAVAHAQLALVRYTPQTITAIGEVMEHLDGEVPDGLEVDVRPASVSVKVTVR